MPDFGIQAPYIWGAYAVTFAALSLLTLYIFLRRPND